MASLFDMITTASIVTTIPNHNEKHTMIGLLLITALFLIIIMLIHLIKDKN